MRLYVDVVPWRYSLAPAHERAPPVERAEDAALHETDCAGEELRG